MEEIQMQYGLQNGELIHIDHVESGEKCGCLCPACHGTLIARKGEVKRHHFAHKSEGNCSHAYETTLHLLGKKILSETKELWIPSVYLAFNYKEPFLIYQAMKIPVISVELEQRYHPIIPDVVVTSSMEQKLMVEIFVTHKVDEEKQKKMQEIGISTIEIDLSGYRDNAVTEEELRDILCGESHVKYWIFNRKDAQFRDRFSQKADLLLEENGRVPCVLKQYYGSKESPFVEEEACYECPYLWDDSVGILCGGRLRMKEKEHIFCSEADDVKRVKACQKEEEKLRWVLERKRKFQEDKVKNWHKNLDKGICPDCGESLRFRRRRVDGHKFISCSSWIDEFNGCQFTLDVDSEEAQESDFVKQHEAWSEKSKLGKAERKCGWCGKNLVHRVPKNGNRPFLGCCAFPYCKFVAFYTREELEELKNQKNEAKE